MRKLGFTGLALAVSLSACASEEVEWKEAEGLSRVTSTSCADYFGAGIYEMSLHDVYLSTTKNCQSFEPPYLLLEQFIGEVDCEDVSEVPYDGGVFIKGFYDGFVNFQNDEIFQITPKAGPIWPLKENKDETGN